MPNMVAAIDRLEQRFYSAGYAQRVFGYFHPPADGSYTFGLSCQKCCELRLAPNDNPADAKVIAEGCSHAANTYGAKSDSVQLQANQKYYFDVLHVHTEGLDHLQVAYFVGAATEPRILEGPVISPLLDFTKPLPQDASSREGARWAVTFARDQAKPLHLQSWDTVEVSLHVDHSNGSTNGPRKKKPVDSKHFGDFANHACKLSFEIALGLTAHVSFRPSCSILGCQCQSWPVCYQLASGSRSLRAHVALSSGRLRGPESVT